MKEKVFCIVSPIQQGRLLDTTMVEAERRLTSANIAFTLPKIGKHITFVPPFLASELEMRWLAAGLECAKTFYSPEGLPVLTRGVALDFFKDEKSGVDALIIRLSISQQVMDLIERFRSKVPEHTEWVHPPASYLANLHATIAEGEGLSRAVDAHGLNYKLFKGLNIEAPVQLEPPMLFEKLTGSWKPWRL